jgi:hypothetical protein
MYLIQYRVRHIWLYGGTVGAAAGAIDALDVRPKPTNRHPRPLLRAVHAGVPNRRFRGMTKRRGRRTLSRATRPALRSALRSAVA